MTCYLNGHNIQNQTFSLVSLHSQKTIHHHLQTPFIRTGTQLPLKPNNLLFGHPNLYTKSISIYNRLVHKGQTYGSSQSSTYMHLDTQMHFIQRDSCSLSSILLYTDPCMHTHRHLRYISYTIGTNLPFICNIITKQSATDSLHSSQLQPIFLFP